MSKLAKGGGGGSLSILIEAIMSGFFLTLNFPNFQDPNFETHTSLLIDLPSIFRLQTFFIHQYSKSKEVNDHPYHKSKLVLYNILSSSKVSIKGERQIIIDPS